MNDVLYIPIFRDFLSSSCVRYYNEKGDILATANSSLTDRILLKGFKKRGFSIEKYYASSKVRNEVT
jgi:hypothetical protein